MNGDQKGTADAAPEAGSGRIRTMRNDLAELVRTGESEVHSILQQPPRKHLDVSLERKTSRAFLVVIAAFAFITLAVGGAWYYFAFLQKSTGGASRPTVPAAHFFFERTQELAAIEGEISPQFRAAMRKARPLQSFERIVLLVGDGVKPWEFPSLSYFFAIFGGALPGRLIQIPEVRRGKGPPDARVSLRPA